MRYLSQFFSNRNISCRYLHLQIGHNQLRLNNMLSTRSQLLGIGLQFAKNLNRSVISKTAVTRKLDCSYFSVKVDVQGDIPPLRSSASPQPQPNREKDKLVANKTHVYGSLRWHQDGDNAVPLINNLKTIVRSSMRDTNAIQSICTKLLNIDLNLNIKESVDVLYYLSVLNVHEEELLMKILKIITARLSDIYKPSPMIVCILKSVRNLQIRYPELLNGLITWYVERHEYVEPSEAATLIQTLAVLNYFPANGDILLKRVLNHGLTEHSSSLNYLNFVWALTLIDRLQPEIAESVMVPSFRKKLESILDPGIRSGAYLKLINIHGYINLRKFKIQVDPAWSSMENIALRKIRDRRMKDVAIKNLIDCLVNALPNRTFNTFSESNSGCIIDAVCFFDKDHNPITELDSVKKKDCIKLAILFLLYKDLCSPHKTIPNGIVEFHRRFLESSGYRVLYVPFNEFPRQESLRKKSSYIKQKIRFVLPNFEQSEE